MPSNYKIHPAIGIARLGDSKDDFYLAPEEEAALPIECDKWGNPSINAKTKKPIPFKKFKDKENRVRRQAAKFSIYVYDDANPEGRKLKIGDTIEGIGSSGKLIDIKWTAYLANKKSAWYQFEQLEGSHGYSPTHPLRNKNITNTEKRQKLIIDPGPQTIFGKRSSAKFAKGENPAYAQTFPPKLHPHSIHTLGEIKTNDDHELIVLGGHGKSGSFKTSFGNPKIEAYANNEGWFDDTSDGPVTAFLAYVDTVDQQVRYLAIEDPSWVVVGYPSYAPEIADMVTMNEVVNDVAVRDFAYNPYLYGTGNFNQPQTVAPEDLDAWRAEQKTYNPDYYPYFYKELWPILQRPFKMWAVTSYIGQSFQPHDTGVNGNFYEKALSTPPKNGEDPYAYMREKIYLSLRQPGEENVFYKQNDPRSSNVNNPSSDKENDPTTFQILKPLMPLLCGDNPITNDLPSKFLRLTDTMLFLLRQWRDGKFINELSADIDPLKVERADRPGDQLDYGALSNALGGSFCLGAELTWIIRNPAIFKKAYRINANLDYIPSQQTDNVGATPGLNLYERPALSLDNSIDDGIEPGDLTKYSAMPWQSDFNECSSQPIDITYQQWNKIYPNTQFEKDNQHTNTVLWWPSHRPLQVFLLSGQQADWARGIPQTNEGDLRMVKAWKWLGFVRKVKNKDGKWVYVETERNDDKLGPAQDPAIPMPKKSKSKS